jgi:hypothetical protein
MTIGNMLKEQFTLPVVISLIALSVSAGSAIITTRNVYSANRPYLTAVPQLDPTADRVGVYLVNSGSGAAILSNITLTIHGKTYSGLGPNVWDALETDAGFPPSCFRTSWPRKDDALKSGEEDPLIVLSGLASSDCVRAAKRLLADDLHVRIEYRSVFEQSYTWDGSTHLFGLDIRQDSKMAART